jgi:hypothetical protein
VFGKRYLGFLFCNFCGGRSVGYMNFGVFWDKVVFYALLVEKDGNIAIQNFSFLLLYMYAPLT